MTPNTSVVKLPDELIHMFHLARDAFVFYETETGMWDEESMIRFRDVLYDLVQASETDHRESQLHYIGAAMEHLALTISEPLQRRTETLLLESERPIKLFKIFRLTHNFSGNVSLANIDEIKKRIEHHLSEGRKAKVRLSLSEAQAAYDSFREAYKGAVLLQQTLKDRKLKLPFVVLFWFLSVALSAVISVSITLALT